MLKKILLFTSFFVLICIISATRSQLIYAQNSGRIYELFNLVTFDDADCISGWETDIPDGWAIKCHTDEETDNTKGVWLEGPREQIRTSAMLWRNDLFPTNDINIAIEIRFRYPRMRQPYGQDAYNFYDRDYNGQRLEDQGGNLCELPQNEGSYWIDPGCGGVSRVAGYSHGEGTVRNRRVALNEDNHRSWPEVEPTEWWTAVYHYEASTGNWHVAVSKAADSPQRSEWAEPIKDNFFDQWQAVTGISMPSGFKIGHHVHKIPPVFGGQWNEVMLDYISIWTWNDQLVGPQCTDVKMLDSCPDGSVITDYSTLTPNQTVAFKCFATQTTADTYYQFRIIHNGNTILETEPTNNACRNFSIPDYGRFRAECRACTGPDEDSCEP